MTHDRIICAVASSVLPVVLVALFTVLAPRAGVAGEVDDDYRLLLDASEAEEHVKALELGEVFLVEHPDSKQLASALHLAAKSGIASSNFARAAILYRRIVNRHPDDKAIDEARFGLVQCLAGMRSLDECIEQCRENLKVAPESSGADYYHFLIPQSQFRLWRFKQAEEGLKDFLDRRPDSTYAAPARRYLEKINPSWAVDGNGIAEYSGKYEGDYRLEAALADLPKYIEEGRNKIRDRLGVDIDFKENVNFIFRDSGADKRGGLMAETFIISRDYKPVTVIQLYSEHVVTDPAGYRRTVIHEMKHAGFKVIMGTSYDDLPDWIAEGLAQWAAEELDHRLVSKLTNETFAGKDPLSELNGVANPAHSLADYLEDVLAFEWLENQKPGNVIAFSKGLVEGKAWQELLAAASGLETEQALREMDRHCQDRVADELGRAGRRVLKLRDTYYAKAPEGAVVVNEWLREEGNREFAEWVDKYPDHALAPVARFYSGRGLILTGSFAKGREWLRKVIEGEGENSLSDDALFWEGYAFQQENRMADATRSFRVLLRDYSWSNSAPKMRGKFAPAGPERKKPDPPAEIDKQP